MAAWEVSPRRGTALSWRSHLFPSKLVGGAAALLTTLCWLPRALKLLRTRETRDLSLLAYVVFSAGILLWLLYGLLIGSVRGCGECGDTGAGARHSIAQAALRLSPSQA
jgi:uncharacterized protein with PQ loop repeat